MSGVSAHRYGQYQRLWSRPCFICAELPQRWGLGKCEHRDPPAYEEELKRKPQPAKGRKKEQAWQKMSTW